jgi:hypothetical protein
MNELELARNAFVEAHGRFLYAHRLRNVSAWYAALGETLWWIVALDDHYTSVGGEHYRELQRIDQNGRVVPGLRLARNRAGHQLAVLLADPTGRSVFEPSEAHGGVSLDQLVWRPSNDLPIGRAHPAQLESYDEYLANQAVRYSLRRANYFFVRKRAALDHPMS